jgi:hypothetical protein
MMGDTFLTVFFAKDAAFVLNLDRRVCFFFVAGLVETTFDAVLFPFFAG